MFNAGDAMRNHALIKFLGINVHEIEKKKSLSTLILQMKKLEIQKTFLTSPKTHKNKLSFMFCVTSSISMCLNHILT